LFNHESPRRGETFVTRKITRVAVRIKAALQDKLYICNLNAKRGYYRPTEVELLMDDYSKAKKELGWKPKVKFEELNIPEPHYNLGVGSGFHGWQRGRDIN